MIQSNEYTTTPRLRFTRFCPLFLLQATFVGNPCHAFNTHNPPSHPRSCAVSATNNLHDVGGIICREVGIDVKNLGEVIILEATEASQNELVEMACATEEEILQSNSEQLIKTGDPYGAVLWPAASAVSDYLLTTVANERPSKSLEGLTVLELGTGTGLCALAAALGGASKVLATDYEPVPLRLLEYAASGGSVNCCRTKEPDEVEDVRTKLSRIETGLFDICGDSSLPPADIVIAADIMYEPKTGIAAALRTVEALKAGSRVILGCSPGRPGRPHYVSKLKELLPDVDVKFQEVEGRTCSGPRNDLICGKYSPSVSAEPKALRVVLMDLTPQKCVH